MPAWLTVADVASELSCSDDSVHWAIKRGDLPAFRYGRMVRLRREDVDAFIAAYFGRPITRGRP
jgi:excisionase family DNA binding protein